MRIENVNKENYTNTFSYNDYGKKFTYSGETAYSYKNDNMFPINKELVEQVLKDIIIDLSKLDVPIFLIPDQLMGFDIKHNNYIGEDYQGRAYNSHIILGSRKIKPTKENIGCLVIHEIGHVLMYKALNCTWDTSDKVLREYKKIRGIPDKWKNVKNPNWYTRPAEIFAEDFRYLFGADYMLIDPYDKDSDFVKMYGKDLENAPTQEIKNYMIKLLNSLNGI